MEGCNIKTAHLILQRCQNLGNLMKVVFKSFPIRNKNLENEGISPQPFREQRFLIHAFYYSLHHTLYNLHAAETIYEHFVQPWPKLFS